MKLLIIHGTDRLNSESQKVAYYLKDKTEKSNDFEPILISAANEIENYEELVKKANAFLIVTPEYNHGYPGALKMLLDRQLKNYNHKPVAVAGVSSGPWGGVRVIQNLIPVLRELGLVLISKDLQFPYVVNYFDNEGNPIDDKTDSRVKDVLEELAWFSQKLRTS